MISVSTLMVLAASVSLPVLDMEVPGTPNDGMGNPLSTAEVSVEKTWLHSFDQAKSMSLEKKLPLLLHFEADWCGACRTMDSSVMNQPAVLQHLGTSVIAVRINADRDPGLISQYGIASLPTEVFIDDNGNEIGRYVGGTTLQEYTSRMENARNRTSREMSGKIVAGENADETLRPCLLVIREGHLVGLGGFSPVAMHKEKKWLKGDERFLGTYLGVDYFFQSAEERELFFASPEQYVPRLHGFDPVEMQVTRRAEVGAIELGAFYKGRLFFFLNRQNRERFQSNPAWYAEGLSVDGIQNADQFPFLKSMNLN